MVGAFGRSFLLGMIVGSPGGARLVDSGTAEAAAASGSGATAALARVLEKPARK